MQGSKGCHPTGTGKLRLLEPQLCSSFIEILSEIARLIVNNIHTMTPSQQTTVWNLAQIYAECTPRLEGGVNISNNWADRGLGGQSGQGGQGGLGGAESSVPHRDFHGITCESGSPRATPKPLYVTDKILLPVCSLNY